uniref:Uncharacterized protein n=1 Tax=Rhizophora mucronata TaxID=61149 RepID=A0A2P2NSZ6_RHIMU
MCFLFSLNANFSICYSTGNKLLLTSVIRYMNNRSVSILVHNQTPP